LKKILATAGVAAVASAVAPAAAFAAPAPHPGPGPFPVGHTRYADEHLQFTTNDPEGNTYQAQADGNLFWGWGTMTRDGGSNSDPQFRVDLNDGSFQVSAFVGQGGAPQKNIWACTITYRNDNIQYSLQQGTGALRGLEGNGHADLTATAVYPRDSRQGFGCDFNAQPRYQEETITADGPAVLWHL
jgi:hypothetical protein